MKKRKIIKMIMGLGIIFSSCVKKADDPKPSTTTVITPIVVKDTVCDTCANNKMYVFENDTALAFIAKWNGKVIKCVNASLRTPKDTFYITMTKVISQGFSTNYDGHYVLRVTWNYTNFIGVYNKIDYLAFNKNVFIQRIPELNTKVNPWIIIPEKSSYFDFTIIDSITLNFPSDQDTKNKGFRIVN
jgi:hypothetical protein